MIQNLSQDFKNYVRDKVLSTKMLTSLYQTYVRQRIREIESKSFVPKVIYTESTNACNAKCIMCPRDKMTRPIGFMSMELFKKIIVEARNMGTPELRLHNFGEPLLDKWLVEKVKFAKFNKIQKVLMYTNASLLSKEKFMRLIDAGMDEIVISIDGVTKETFEKIRTNLKFDQVIKNIEDVIEIKGRNGIKRPRIHLTLTYGPQNIHEVQPFIKRMRTLVEEVTIHPAHSFGGGVKDNIYLRAYKNRWACPWLWTDLFILWNGDVSICCEDFNGRIILGNVVKDSLESVWFGEAYRKRRKIHYENQFEKLPLCKNCSLILRW